MFPVVAIYFGLIYMGTGHYCKLEENVRTRARNCPYYFLRLFCSFKTLRQKWSWANHNRIPDKLLLPRTFTKVIVWTRYIVFDYYSVFLVRSNEFRLQFQAHAHDIIPLLCLWFEKWSESELSSGPEIRRVETNIQDLFGSDLGFLLINDSNRDMDCHPPRWGIYLCSRIFTCAGSRV